MTTGRVWDNTRINPLRLPVGTVYGRYDFTGCGACHARNRTRKEASPVTETTYLVETGVASVAPQVDVFGLNVPAPAVPTSGRQLAGLGWRHTGGVCPQIADQGLTPTSVPSAKARMADLRPIAAFDNKHSVRGLSAWSPPI
jgi:hypothetical protein